MVTGPTPTAPGADRAGRRPPAANIDTPSTRGKVNKVRAPPREGVEEPKGEASQPATTYEAVLFEGGDSVQEAWKKLADEFEDNFGSIETKIQKFPGSLRGLGVRYMVPTAVAIGPYHCPSTSDDTLREMERVKELAAYHFVRDSGHSLEEIFWAVSSVQGQARSAYTDTATVNKEGLQFAFIMFRDACFLLQYMLMCTASHEVAPSLICCLSSSQAVISRDIMLLENQVPWVVIETLRRFRTVPVEEFIAKMGRTLEVRGRSQRTPFLLDGYRPPHLLGLLHYYKTGRGTNGVPPSVGLRPMSKTISAIELQEMGIKLTASKTTKFVDMGIERRLLSGEIFLAPLLLDQIRSCWLINMAAFEICMGIGTGVRGDNEQPVVCSYLAVLAMLMDRQEDVHKLRSKRLVQGELTNKETLDFFKNLIKHISGGTLYIHILDEIEDYKLNRRMWIKVRVFFYTNLKTIITVVTIIGAIMGMFKVLLSIKKH
ncbi:hypothetical protein ACQJBY_041047 [Aegilops geniculata]